MRTLPRLLTVATLTGSLFTIAGMSSPSGAATMTKAAACVAAHKSALHTSGKLTIATDNPVYDPWFTNNKPSNKKGYESAVAYAIAKEMGFSSKKVTWVHEPFDSSYQPGKKAFDFDLNEISYTAQRASVVSFSKSYYDVTQSIIALKTNPIVTKHSSADLKTYRYGDQIGTTGLSYITKHLQPTAAPKVYNTLEDAVSALKAKQIDAIVVDTPTGQYMASEYSGEFAKGTAVQVGQFPTTGEHFGALFSKGSKLVGCVNLAIAAIKKQGTLKSINKKDLGIYNQVPKLKP